MELDFELNKYDLIRKHRVISGQKYNFGFWTIVLLIACSVAQFLFLWFSDVLFGLPRLDPPLSRLVLIGIVVYSTMVLVRYYKRTNFPPLNVVMNFQSEFVYERSGNTEYQKAYACFDQVEEDAGYFVLRHAGNAMVIPKRVLNAEQQRWFSAELPRLIRESSETAVPFYQQSFGQDEGKALEFQWSEEDLEQMGRASFTVCKPGKGIVPASKKSSKALGRRVVVRWIMGLVALVIVTYSAVEMNLLWLPTLVFATGFVALNEVSYIQRNRYRRLLSQSLLGKKSGVLVTSEEVWIGQPRIVNRHVLSDIVNVCFSDYFVALQSNDQLMYVVPKRAIGGEEMVRQFLANVQGAIGAVDRVETGNPYQPPTL